jgi:hypothetical protein
MREEEFKQPAVGVLAKPNEGSSLSEQLAAAFKEIDRLKCLLHDKSVATTNGVGLQSTEECPECKRRREAKRKAMKDYRSRLPKAKRGRGRPKHSS